MDVHFTECQTFTDVSGIVNEFTQYVRNYYHMYTYPFNPQLVIKAQGESHDKKPKDQRNFYTLTAIWHCTRNYILCTFWRLKTLVLLLKIVQNILIFVHLFFPNNSAIDPRKTSITQERLVVESCPTPCWITFLMLYRLVHNILSYFNELILVWSAYFTMILTQPNNMSICSKYNLAMPHKQY